MTAASLDLAAIRRRYYASTLGKWEAHDVGPTAVERPGKKPMLVDSWADAEFIVHAHNADVPMLLDAVEELLAALDALERDGEGK